MEVMRDRADNCVIICSIENLDPMGVHTGDSITVAPIQTLTDREYQIMRDCSFACIREIGVETGGSNIQFAVHPGHGPHDRHRDEPARQPQLRAGVEGHRLPHREDRRQARRRLHARRAEQRHHARDARLLRADHRLRRHQDAALHLREIPRSRRDAHHADEVRGRGHGHRPHLQGEPAEGPAQPGDQALRPDRRWCRQVEVDDETLTTKLTVPNAERIFFLGQAFAKGWGVEKGLRADQDRPLVLAAD